jgi:hypothetical protein
MDKLRQKSHMVELFRVYQCGFLSRKLINTSMALHNLIGLEMISWHSKIYQVPTTVWLCCQCFFLNSGDFGMCACCNHECCTTCELNVNKRITNIGDKISKLHEGNISKTHCCLNKSVLQVRSRRFLALILTIKGPSLCTLSRIMKLRNSKTKVLHQSFTNNTSHGGSQILGNSGPTTHDE